MNTWKGRHSDASHQDHTFARWQAWTDRLRDEVATAHGEREIWREMSDALNSRLPGSRFFLNHYARLYADTQAMRVRRLVDRGHDALSLARLLTEIQMHRDVLTCDRYIDISMSEASESRRYFNNVFGRGDHVSDSVLEGDLERLEAAGRPVRRWADVHVAHALSRPRSITYGNIHHAIDEISAVFVKYYVLFYAAELDPVPGLLNWKAPFRTALFEDASPRGE